MRNAMMIVILLAGGLATACTTTPRDQETAPRQNAHGRPCGDAAISIHIPATPPGPLTLSHGRETVPNAPSGRGEVREGCAPHFATVGGAGGDRVLIVFTEETPFKDAQGQPVYVVQADRASSAHVMARDYSEGVCTRTKRAVHEPQGCKYTAVHFRPNGQSAYIPLDPRIIIVQ